MTANKRLLPVNFGAIPPESERVTYPDYPKGDFTLNPFAAPSLQGEYKQPRCCGYCYSCYKDLFSLMCFCSIVAMFMLVVTLVLDVNVIGVAVNVKGSTEIHTMSWHQFILLLIVSSATTGVCCMFAISVVCRVCEWLFNLGRC